MEPTNLQKAIAVAQKASQQDEEGNCEEAILSYQHAVKYFLHILKREPQGKDGNQKIRDKCKQYLDRVEELQAYLVNKEELRTAIEDEWTNIPQATIDNLINSMRRRCVALHEANGGHTRY